MEADGRAVRQETHSKFFFYDGRNPPQLVTLRLRLHSCLRLPSIISSGCIATNPTVTEVLSNRARKTKTADLGDGGPGPVEAVSKSTILCFENAHLYHSDSPLSTTFLCTLWLEVEAQTCGKSPVLLKYISQQNTATRFRFCAAQVGCSSTAPILRNGKRYLRNVVAAC